MIASNCTVYLNYITLYSLTLRLYFKLADSWEMDWDTSETFVIEKMQVICSIHLDFEFLYTSNHLKKNIIWNFLQCGCSLLLQSCRSYSIEFIDQINYSERSKQTLFRGGGNPKCPLVLFTLMDIILPKCIKRRRI